ncbi:MAG: hypothetical protein U9R37_02330 [Campylobacterota bacterium]|nr:hypothetical protein [Campylobacterota bacterium]
MQITALTDIVEGKLLNTPAISFITQIILNVKKVHEGDAFICFDQEDIQIAVKNGAFAIISEFIPDIIDNEIAFIKVDSINKAITNSLRYKLLNKNINFIKINKIFYHLLKIFKTKDMKDIILLKNDINIDFELLNNIETTKIIFSTNDTFLSAITSDFMILKNHDFKIENLTTHSLFETSFSHKDKFFDRLKLPTVYINDLLEQLELFDYKLDLKKLHNFNLFKPLFINKSSQIVPFGQTNRFILANEDSNISDIEINFLEKSYTYGDIKILDAKELDDDEIFICISNLSFNALYIKNCDISRINIILDSNNKIDKLL